MLYNTKQNQKDAQKLLSSELKTKTQQLLSILQSNLWQILSPLEKLVGDLSSAIQEELISSTGLSIRF